MADMMMPGTMAPEPPSPSMDQLAAFEQMRQQVSPTEVNRELLTSAEEVDPVAVADFRKELADLNVPPEVIDMLRTMVDEVLATPEDYPAIRQKYLAMGVDEELLPEAFDAALFAALNVALDELGSKMPEPMPMAPPQGFARGGIASLKPMAREMAAAGRYGDTMLAHISPVEAQILRRYGGSGTINPVTGAPEFFLKKMFKSIGKAVKKFASSTIGKIVIGTALFMVAGPAAASMLGASAGGAVAAGISGFVSGAGTTLLAGGNLKEALKAGAIGGMTAGVAKGVTNRLNAPSAAAEGATARPATVASAEGITRAPLEGMGTAAPAAPAAPAMPTVAPPPAPAATPIARAVESMTAPAQATPFTYTPPPLPQGIAALPTPPPAPPTIMQRIAGAPRAIMDTLSPTAIRDRAIADTATKFGYASPGELAAAVKSGTASAAATSAYEAAVPGLLRQYGPLAATGLGIMALTGAAEEEPQTIPPGFEDFAQGISPGAQLLANEPQRYGLNFGGVQTLATPEAYNPYTFYAPPRRAAKGGSMEKHFPRKNGPINGPGTGTSDSIPAMLSDGEFVFTAKAVRGMGNGSRRAGAKKMYALMKKLEGRQNG
ncbi:MAG: hypothetical protein EBS68_14335 [Rhodobacteraceae bacterium]|jgi:hypothetical protein|nr:hypothetical protein [Paracoccaceae bacterium]